MNRPTAGDDVRHAQSGARPDALTLATFFAAAALAGANPVAIRLGFAELAPFWWAAVRFLAAGLILCGVVAVRRLGLPRGRALLGVVVYGALNFGLAFSFTYYALTEVTAATNQVVLALVPLLTLILATIQRIERFRWQGLAGALVAAAGVYLLFRESVAVASLAALLALLAGAVAIAEVNIVVKAFPPVHPVVQAGLGMAVGGLMQLALSLVVGEPWAVPREPATLLSLAYLIAFGSIGLYVLYLFVLGRWTATGTSYSWLIAPLVTVVLGVVILGEPVTPWFAVGGALVLAGVYVGAFTTAARPAARGSR
jgi:O-acetylserine/cysteine efflux transporter